MKITNVRIARVPPSWVWVFIDTDEGITGIGEPYLESHSEAVISEVHRLSEALVGEDPTRIEMLWRRMYQAVYYYRGGPVTMSAISGIDMALWDIAGKAANLPIHRMLGGPTTDRVELYGAIAWGQAPRLIEPGQTYGLQTLAPLGLGTDDPSAWADAALAWAELGITAVKLHYTVGDSLSARGLNSVGRNIVAAVRAAVGAQAPLMIDLSHTQRHVSLRLIDALEEFDLLFIEDPQQLERFLDLAQICRSSRTPIAAGAGWMTKFAFADAIAAGLTVAQPDLSHAGGITECKKIAALTEAAYGYFAPHCPSSIVQIASCLQVGASCPNYLIQEFSTKNLGRLANGDTVLGAGYLTHPLVVRDGCVDIPTGPGLGIEVDMAAIASMGGWSSSHR